MPKLTTSYLRAFSDCREILDQALANNGGQINCETYARAITLRRRCNHFRKLDRDSNLETYQPDDRMYGKSAYDNLELSVPAKGNPFDSVITITVRQSGPYTVVPLGTFQSPKEPN